MNSGANEQAFEIPKSAVLNGNEENPWTDVIAHTYRPSVQALPVEYSEPSSEFGVNCSKENVFAARKLSAEAQEAMDYVNMQTSFVELGGKLADLPQEVREAGLAKEKQAVEVMSDLISVTSVDDLNSVLLMANNGLEDVGLQFAVNENTQVVTLMEDGHLLWDLAKPDRRE